MQVGEWADVEESAGQYHLTQQQIAYISTTGAQVAAGRALADVQQMIDSLPEHPIVGFAFVVVLQEAESEGETKALLYGPRLMLAEVLAKLAHSVTVPA